jgi:hypothetical protein
MSITLNKLAHKFTLILKKYADEFEFTDPEISEDLDGVIKDSLHLLILLQRSMSEFSLYCHNATGETKELGGELADTVLSELQEIEANLQNPDLINKEDIAHQIVQSITMIRSALELIRPNPREKMPESFKTLDQRVFKWLNELEENIFKLVDQPMLEQVDTDVDQILREDISPGHPDFEPEESITQREEEAAQRAYDEEGETPHPMQLKDWGEEFSSGVKNFSDRWEPEGDHWVEKKN